MRDTIASVATFIRTSFLGRALAYFVFFYVVTLLTNLALTWHLNNEDYIDTVYISLWFSGPSMIVDWMWRQKSGKAPKIYKPVLIVPVLIALLALLIGTGVIKLRM